MKNDDQFIEKFANMSNKVFEMYGCYNDVYEVYGYEEFTVDGVFLNDEGIDEMLNCCRSKGLLKYQDDTIQLHIFKHKKK